MLRRGGCQDGQVTIDLLPLVGVRLPASLPELRFGMSHSDVCRVMEGRALVAGAFVCGSDWAASFRLSGCSVIVSASNGHGLSAISVSRQPTDGHPAGPVGFLDIDLFGWPTCEIVKALRAQGLSVAEHHSGNVWVDDLHLSPASGQVTATVKDKPRRQPPRVFDYACLYGPSMRSDRLASEVTLEAKEQSSLG